MEALEADDDVNYMVGWLQKSEVGVFVHVGVWGPIRDGCFQGLMNDYSVLSASVVDQSSILEKVVGNSTIGRLINCDCAALASEAQKYIEFGSGGTGKTEVLPYIKTTTIFIHALTETSRGTLLAPGLQHSLGEPARLPDRGDELSGRLLLEFAQMRTVMMMASVAHSFLFGPSSQTLFGIVSRRWRREARCPCTYRR